MKMLLKLPLSDALNDYLASRMKAYAALLIANEKIPKAIEGSYSTEEIKNLLKQETHEKCAYCESRMLHVDYGDVEHIKPKHRNPYLRFDYANLTLSCGVCNTNKSTHADILNPYETNPSEHLVAHGPAIFRRSVSNIGMTTEKRLDLNRPQLLQKRNERLQALQQIADQIGRTNDAAIKSVLIDELRAESSGDKEFSLVARTFISEIFTDLGLPQA